MEADIQGRLRTCSHRPVLSQDGSFVAVITAKFHLRLLRLEDDGSLRADVEAPLSKSLQQVVTRLSTLKWASNGPNPPRTSSSGRPDGDWPWLLISDGSRLLVLNPNELPSNFSGSVARSATNLSFVAADYQLGDQFGKLSFAEFVLDFEHVLALFEMGPQAAILSLTKPHRDEIPNVKFNHERALAMSPDGRSLAVLLRNKGLDQVMVLGLKDGVLQTHATFNTQTNDGQGVIWSPDGDPVLAVYDSAAYSVKVVFFSALGHPLKSLEVSAFDNPLDVLGVGITNLKWLATNDGSILAAADGEKQVLMRQQYNRKMSVKRLALFAHSSVIDGAKSIVWQQTGIAESPFVLQKGAFNAILDPNAGGGVNILEFSSDRSFVATIVAENLKAVWLWQPDHPEPHTVILFQENVQQLLWHPEQAGVLLVITNQNVPAVFVWYSETKAPITCYIPLQNTTSTRFHGRWLDRSVQGRHPFMLTTMKAFEVGMLEEEGGIVMFKSILQDAIAADGPGEDEDTTEEISTPSKPSKKGQGSGKMQVMQAIAARTFDPSSASKW